MNSLLSVLKISIPENIFLKDPESSELGKRIVENSILMIDEIGFDNFTFKKLGIKIGSNESSIYRYFESKHKLLLYLSSWYWAWIEYQLVFETINISDPLKTLEKGIQIVTRTIERDNRYSHINEVILNRIIVNENSKSFLTKQVDQENKEGYFIIYKRLINRLKELIFAVNPQYPYASSLSSTIVDGALHQHFLKDHFRSITNCSEAISPSAFFINLTFQILK
ncbi:MAG: TetR/AcrR family transcriptional regulator [Flavobacteriaceae bacterium]|nr:TetR/AcrR family transcriptional regulator [Flavobacteriaceae bacterium]